MTFAIGLVSGVIVGVILLLAAGRGSGSWPLWALFAIGVLGAAILAMGFAGFDTNNRFIMSAGIALPFAGSILGIGLLVRGRRDWRTWTGTAIAAAPALFWLVFGAAEILFPHD